MVTSVSRAAQLLRNMGEAQATATLNDRIARAFLLDGGARELALDVNARLMTELRVLKVWPARFQPDQQEDDGA